MELREDQIERYSRQIILPQLGGEGQEKLLNASILVIGAGGLGSPSYTSRNAPAIFPRLSAAIKSCESTTMPREVLKK